MPGTEPLRTLRPGGERPQPGRPAPQRLDRTRPLPRHAAPIASEAPSAPTELDRLHGLLEAHRAIADDLSLAAILRRIITAACDLVGARYGALGVVREDGGLEQFVYTGVDDATVARIGALPIGRGLLGALIDEQRAIRVDDIGADPRSCGFPPHHPPMRAFLGVPIQVRDEVFGHLYLTEPDHGTFTEPDEQVVTALATAAGSAIANARVYDDARRSRDWLNASGEIARALLANADDDMFLEIVSRARTVGEADYGAIILPTDDGRLMVTVTNGVGADDFRGLVFDPDNSAMGKAMIRGESLLLTDLTYLARNDYENVHGFGPVMVAPLVDAKGVRGAVILIRTVGRPTFTQRELGLATVFADQVALALELNEARADAERVRGLEERHRLARDLNDNVMQRLFATGVGLQSIADGDLPPDVADRIRRHIVDLDETIDDIRARVFGLRDQSDADGRIR